MARSGLADFLDINMPVGKIQAQLQLLRRLLNQSNITDILGIDVDKSKLTAQLAEISKLTESIPVSFDVTAPDIPGIAGLTDTITAVVNDTAARTELTALTRPRVVELTAEMLTAATTSSSGGGSGVGNFTGLVSGADDASGAFGKLEKAKDSLSTDIDTRLNPAVSRAGGGFGLWGLALGGLTGGIGLWHVALDGAIEAVIAVGGAAAAAATGLAAMASTVNDIYNHVTAVNAVNSALGDQITVLGGQFRSFAEGVQNSSQVLGIYGGLINLARGQTGTFVSVGHEVVTLFDTWIAKIDVWSQSQDGLGKLLQAGVGFLTQFGSILGKVLIAIGNLLTADPGIAHFLLDLVSGFSSVLDWVSKLPAPLVEFGLALHGAYLWGNVLVGVLGRLVPGLGGVSKALLGWGKGPLLVLTALGIGAYQLAAAWDSASPKVAADIARINSSLNSMTASQALAAIPGDIGAINARLAGLNTSSIIAGWQGVSGVFQRLDDQYQAVGKNLATSVDTSKSFAQQASAAWHAVFDFFAGGVNQSASATVQLQHDMTAYKNEIDGLLGKQQHLVQAMGALTDGSDKFGVATHSVAASLALMDLAGVQAGDSVAVMLQKVDNLVTGYQAMGVQGPLLTAAVNAVTFATELQQSKVGQLNSSWDTFIGVVSGGESGLIGFGGALNTMTTDIKNVNGSFTGLSAGSLQLQNDFQQTLTAANSQMDALTTMAAAAGEGAKGTTLLSGSTKDLVAEMLPAAKGSGTLTAELYALAQRGGYQGADSFKQLSMWVGNTRNPMKDLQGITEKLTKASAGLTTDTKNLATALHQDLNGAMAQVIFTESGGLKPMEDLFAAIKTTGLNSTTTAKSALALGQQYLTLTGNVTDAKAQFVTFAEKGLNLTQAQADALWNEIKGKLQPVIGSTGDTAVQAAGKIDNNFVKSLQQIGFTIPGVQGDVKNFTNAVQATGDTSTRTAGARAKLIADLEKSGVQANVAKSLVNGLQNQINALKGKTVNVGLTTSGSGQIVITGTGISTRFIDTRTGKVGLAKGGLVTQGSGPAADDVLVALSKGELVVPAHLTKLVAPLLSGKIPGLAAGGMVGGPASAENAIGSAAAAVGQLSVTDLAQAAIKAAQAQLAAMAGTPVAYSKIAGVTQWEGDVLRVLSMLGLPAADLPTVMAQILTESGGDPNAINLTDSNAAAGTPSKGLLQLIAPTFAAYRNAGLSSNIYDPTANIYAGLNYAVSRYGNPGWLSVLGHGHGYDAGGWLPPGMSMAVNNTGQYERVTPPGKGKMTTGEQAICDRLDALLGQGQQAPRKTAEALNLGSAATGTRGTYSYANRR